MREIRSFIDQPLALGSVVDLPEGVATHLLRVLRLGPGDPVTLFNGDGHDYRARLLDGGKRAARAELVERVAVERESPLPVVLLQGVARGEKMDLILQKACELGVAAVQPVQSERSEVRLDGERAARREAHWLGVLQAAAEQSGRARVPALWPLRPLHAALAELPPGLRLLLSPHAEGGLRSLPVPAAGTPVQLLIGPEGGLGERDLAMAGAAGFRSLRMGPRVLRTETAGLTALALLQGLWGDLG
jgi:16S rRNA (uracil1498-N3)-methyltransferase